MFSRKINLLLLELYITVFLKFEIHLILFKFEL